MNALLIGPVNSTFVKNDIEILSKHYKLKALNSVFGRGMKGLFNLSLLTVKSLYYILTSKFVYCWFADYSTLLPTLFARLLGKKVFVVAGGFDARYIPEINYGAKTRPLRWFSVKNSFRFASAIFPVSEFTKNSLINLIESKLPPITVIYNGVNLERVRKDNKVRQHFLTLSQAETVLEAELKGIYRFIDIARQNPHRSFVLAGLRGASLEKAELEGASLNNLQILKGPLDFETELLPLYNSSIAYLQLSIEETFGVAVIEALAAGCVAITSNCGALPEVVGQIAIVTENDEQVNEAIEKATQIDENSRSKYRAYVEKYDINKREQKIIAEIRKFFS